MDPNAPLTTGQFTQAVWALLIGFVAPWVTLIPAIFLCLRWRDRRALRKAQARWRAWEAAHPREPPDESTRRWQIRDRLWLESQPAYLQAHLLRERLAEAERGERAQAILEAERRGEDNGPG